MEFDYLRDYTMYAAVFGFFSFVWFGWAQENPPQTWRKYLGFGSVIAFIVCAIGVYLSIQNWHAKTALSELNNFLLYLSVFYGEFIIAAIGVFLLFRFKRKDFVAPWIAFLVGIHFYALVFVFHDNSLFLLAKLMIIIAIGASIFSRKLNISKSALTGLGSGIVLFRSEEHTSELQSRGHLVCRLLL